MKKSYRFRIYPTGKQEIKLLRTLDTCRNLYNDALAERRRQSDLNRLERSFEIFPWGKPDWITYKQQQNALPASKTPYQKDVYSQVLQNVLKRVDRTFQNFFRGCGYPRFKGKNRYDSFTYPQSGFEVRDNRLTLSKIGSVKIILHRDIEGRIKTCTIKHDVDQWYAVFTAEIERPIQEVPVVTKIGIDVGLTHLLTLSNGETIDPPEFFRASELKLSKEQVRLSRKKPGSKNRGKQKVTVARVHRKIRNQRRDFAHKVSRSLVNRFDFIAFENLHIQNMMQNRHLAKGIADAGWYELQSMTAFKAEEAGKRIKLCTAAGTSQICHVCGNKQKMTLRDRVFRCNSCGTVEDRDVNASRNVLQRCTVGTTGFEACQSGLGTDTMKQEAPYESVG